MSSEDAGYVGGDFVGRDKTVIGRDQYNATGDIHIYQTVATPTKPSKPILSYEPATVLIPAGEFWMGADEAGVADPEHVVGLPAYRLGVYPITNEQFAQFVRQTKRVASPDWLWDGNQPARGELKHPVMGVTWQEALAYCGWLSEVTERPYALPSEAQWEKGARGTDGRLYPWGNVWEPARCNDQLGMVTAVDAFPPQSPYGCGDMVGNAREWTTTLWGTAPREPAELYRYPWREDGRDDVTAPPTTRRVFRGGQGDAPTAYQCHMRGAFLPTKGGPRPQRHGFRVVLLMGE
jgi:formylglycine-generating enzyme required for sulfatase activity